MYSEKKVVTERAVCRSKSEPADPLQLADLCQQHGPVAHRRLDAQLARRSQTSRLADAPRTHRLTDVLIDASSNTLTYSGVGVRGTASLALKTSRALTARFTLACAGLGRS